MRRKSIATFAIVAAVSGCSVGPHYKAPNPAGVKLHQAQPSEISQEKFDGKWWGQFDDPVLNGLVDSALRANWDIEIARAKLVESRAIYDERKLDKYPTISSSASYQQAREVVPGFIDTPVNIKTYQAGFDAFWELDVFGRVRHQVGAAAAQNQAFQANLRDVQVSVAAEVARNYFLLRGAQWRLAVAQRSLVNQQDTLKWTEVRRDAGVGEEQDVASAAARVAQTAATIPDINAAILVFQNRIAVLTGVRPGELAADLSVREYTPITKSLPIGDPNELLRRRPDVQAAERRLAQATELQGSAVADLFPHVTFGGFLGFIAGRGSTFFQSDSEAWSFGPSITWPALDYWRFKARVRQSSAVTQENYAEYEQTVLRALEETENALISYHANQEKLIKLNDQARESKRAADIARDRYREGVIDFLQLLDAERVQLEAEDNLAQVEGDVFVAVVTIYKALGGLPDDTQLPGSRTPAVAANAGAHPASVNK
jgi:multidrug efflux system outer membrane protein